MKICPANIFVRNNLDLLQFLLAFSQAFLNYTIWYLFIWEVVLLGVRHLNVLQL